MGGNFSKCGVIYPDLWSRFVAGTGTNAYLWSRFVPPTGTKGLFSAAQRAGSRDLWSRLVARPGTKGRHWSRFVPPTGTKGLFSAACRDLWSRLVARPGTKGVHWSRFVEQTGTNGLRLAQPRCGWMFSPTSLAERLRHLFISAAAPSLSNSSELQAYGPNLTLLCLWAYWACCGPESWPGWVSSRIQAVLAQ